jgi:hypothetical protein
LKAIKALGGSATHDELVAKIIELEAIPESVQNVMHNDSQTKLSYNLAWTKTYLKKGSPQEFVGGAILRGFPDFLKSDVFGVGHGHTLRFQEEVAQVLVPTARESRAKRLPLRQRERKADLAGHPGVRPHPGETQAARTGMGGFSGDATHPRQHRAPIESRSEGHRRSAVLSVIRNVVF